MKPSKRIYEIYKELKQHRIPKDDIDYLNLDIKSIVNFLDEEFEKNQLAKRFKEVREGKRLIVNDLCIKE